MSTRLRLRRTLRAFSMGGIGVVDLGTNFPSSPPIKQAPGSISKRRSRLKSAAHRNHERWERRRRCAPPRNTLILLLELGIGNWEIEGP
jgi:hypothetical protein